MTMHLADYMVRTKISDDKMAELIGRTRPTVSRIRRGKVRPDWPTIEKIKAATGGAVTADDFINMPVSPAPVPGEAA